MKKVLLTLFLLSGITLHAQDRLEPTVKYGEDAPLCIRFYQQELSRLLNPDNAAWGVIREPENMTESSLTYDAATSTLVYTEIDGILWSNVVNGTRERIEINGGIMYKDLDKPNEYKAPDTKTSTLPVSKEFANKLKALWIIATSTQVENDIIVLGGCIYKFFADGICAQANGKKSDWTRVPRLEKLAFNLMQAVRKQDSNSLLQLEKETDELYRMFAEKE